MRVKEKIKLGKFWQPSAVLFVLLISLFFMFFKQSDMVDTVHHTWKIKAHLFEIRNAIKNVETGQRGYLLTQETSYLEPYHKGKSEYEIYRNDLLKLISYDVEHINRFKKVDSLYKLKTIEMDSTIELVENGQDSLAVAVVDADIGQEYADEMRKHLNIIMNEESNLLEMREENYRFWRHGSYLILIFSAILSIYLIIRLYNYIVPFFDELVDTRKALHNSNANMSETIASLKAEFNEKEIQLQHKEKELRTLNEKIDLLNKKLGTNRDD